MNDVVFVSRSNHCVLTGRKFDHSRGGHVPTNSIQCVPLHQPTHLNGSNIAAPWYSTLPSSNEQHRPVAATSVRNELNANTAETMEMTVGRDAELCEQYENLYEEPGVPIEFSGEERSPSYEPLDIRNEDEDYEIPSYYTLQTERPSE